MSNFSEMKEFIDYTFYKMESDIKGFDENLQKFKEELFAYCEQLGFKTEKYVGVHHLVEFTVKDENNRDYDVTLFSFDYKIKNKMSYLYLDDTVRGILKHRKDDMFIYLERNDDTLYNCSLDDKLIEYKKLAITNSPADLTNSPLRDIIFSSFNNCFSTQSFINLSILLLL